MWGTPLAIALILLPVRNERMGGSAGPSYVTTASVKARNKARAWLEQHYRIVPQSPAETGWVLGTQRLKI